MKRREFLKLSGTVAALAVAPSFLGELKSRAVRLPAPSDGTGRTFYVSPKGNNRDGLSWKTAYRSLEDLDAAQVLADGAVVYLQA